MKRKKRIDCTFCKPQKVKEKEKKREEIKKRKKDIYEVSDETMNRNRKHQN